MRTLTSEEIRLAHDAVPEWEATNSTLERTYEFADFPTAIKFVNAVARAAERAHHHPEMIIRWNRVTLLLTTHEAGGLTERDFELAEQCDLLNPPLG